MARHILELGYTIVERNARTALGEIDIVARDGDVLCFVEVRSREDDSLGSPAETVGPGKQRRLRRLAAAYMDHRGLDAPARFDVAAVVWSPVLRLDYIPDAFE